MTRLTDPKCYYAGYMGFTVMEFKERLIKLGKYEDSGREPEEIAALDHDVAMLKQSTRLANELANENIQLKEQIK